MMDSCAATTAVHLLERKLARMNKISEFLKLQEQRDFTVSQIRKHQKECTRIPKSFEGQDGRYEDTQSPTCEYDRVYLRRGQPISGFDYEDAWHRSAEYASHEDAWLAMKRQQETIEANLILLVAGPEPE